LAREEVRECRGGGRIGREQPGNDAFALGDMDFFAVAEQVFHSGKSITKIADAGLLHVMYFSITCCEIEERLNAETQSAQRKDRGKRRRTHPQKTEEEHQSAKSEFATFLAW
jgi:hypothetical protein